MIFTARDLARTVPAAWQEFMQNRDEWTWPEFLESVVSDDASPGSPGARFWAQQDLAALLRSWTEVLPLEDVHVVTLPHPGAAPDVLWERLCQVLGRSYPHGRPAAGSNSSLGMESAEMMRRLNRLAREDGLPTALYQKAFKHELAKGVLAERTRAESRLVLPPEHHEWARREAARQIEAVRACGVHVVGDLAELEPVLDPSPGPQPQDVPDAVLLDIALAALVSMARRWGPAMDSAGKLRTENDRLRARVEHLERHPGEGGARPLRASGADPRLGPAPPPGLRAFPDTARPSGTARAPSSRGTVARNSSHPRRSGCTRTVRDGTVTRAPEGRRPGQPSVGAVRPGGTPCSRDSPPRSPPP